MSSSTTYNLAYSTVGDGKAPVMIGEADRSRHIFAIGQTGTGKSTFIRNLIMQDIAEGRGFSFFDPHGQDAEDLIDYIPPSRIEDTIYFNPQDTDYPMGFNLLSGGGTRRESDLIVSSVIESLRQAWPDAWGPRMEHILRNSLYALLEEPGATLLHVQRLLTDDGYRRVVTNKVTNLPVKHFWEQEFAAYDYRFRVQAIAPIQNKIGYITSSSLLRNLLGQNKAKFNLVDVFDKGQIFIVNLAGIGAKEADFIGSLLLTLFHLTGMRRRAERGETLKVHNLYLDEVHRFSTPTLSNMLSEIRKFNISMTMAQQYLDQNRGEQVRKALLGNVGTVTSFRVSPADSKIISEALDPEIVKPPELTTLGLGECYIRTSVEGKVMTVRAKTSVPIDTRYGRANSIINDSRHTWATTREKIEKRVDRIFGGV